MKRIIVLILVVINVACFGQTPTGYIKIPTRYDWIAGKFDSTFTLPFGNVQSIRGGGYNHSGALFYKTGNSSVYNYDGSNWRRMVDSALLKDTASALRAAMGSGGGSYSARVYYIDSLGGNGNGIFDNATVIKTARNLQKVTKWPIVFGTGTYLTSDSTLFTHNEVYGRGTNTIIKVTTSISPIYALDSCNIHDLSFQGSGQGTIPGGVLTVQNGIRVIGTGNNIYNNRFTNFDGAGIAIYETGGGVISRNRVHGNIYVDCTIGLDLPINAEENVIWGELAYSCTAGFRCRSSGNNSYGDIQATYCGDGFMGEGGGNGAHTTVSNYRFNHNTSHGILIKSSTYGFEFKNGQIWFNDIEFGSTGEAANTTISESMLGGTMTITATSTSGNTCTIRDNVFSSLTLTKAGSDTLRYLNNTNGPDPMYMTSDSGWTKVGNTVGANGKKVGPIDAYDLALITNNTRRVHILSTGEIAFGPNAATAGWGLNIQAPDASASNYSLVINSLASGAYLLLLDNAGNGYWGNNTGSGTNIFYGTQKLQNKTFAGGTGTTPTALLHIAAGTATANTAPLKFTTGTINTTAEAGAKEYNGTFYDTKGSGLRLAQGGVIADFYTDGANSGTGETDLYTYTTPASTLANDGEKITASITVFLSDATADKDIKVYFGGTVIFTSGTMTGVTQTQQYDISIIRVSSSSVRCSVIGASGTGTARLPQYNLVTGLTLSSTNILKITGTASGVGGGTGDITAKLGTISWQGAAAN